MKMEQSKDIRVGEKQASPYRSGRFYSVDNEWYFAVRENKDQGPFGSKLSAENGLKVYLNDFEHFGVNKMGFNINNFELI